MIKSKMRAATATPARWLWLKWLWLALSWLGLFCLHARADLDVKFLGVGSSSKPVFSGTSTATASQANLAYSWALLFDLPIVRRVKLDFGMASLPRSYDSTVVSAYHLPVVVHYRLTPAFALGLGGYYDMEATSSAQSFSSLGLHNWGYGAIASAVLDLPLMPGIGFVVDGRYQVGLRDLDPSGTAVTRFYDWVGYAGFRLGFGR